MELRYFGGLSVERKRQNGLPASPQSVSPTPDDCRSRVEALSPDEAVVKTLDHCPEARLGYLMTSLVVPERSMFLLRTRMVIG